MQSATLSFANIHNHGALFANFLRARRDSFVDRTHWDVPEATGKEYDQYDTPVSRWLAVHDGMGKVRGGLRLTPTTARCGIYSYMIRDAQRGLLDAMPSDLLYGDAPVDESAWEITRGFICDDVSETEQLMVRMRIVKQLIRTARHEGIGRMIALLPLRWQDWSKRSQLAMRAAGPEVRIGGVGYQAVWIDVSSKLH